MHIMSRGDTIIEVLLAITVFSLVSVGGMTIMNQGTNSSQRALEITHVRQQIDAQAEAIRGLQQAAAAGNRSEWSKIAIPNATESKFYGENGDENRDRCPTAASQLNGSFIMNARKASPVTAGNQWNAVFADVNSGTSPPYAKVEYKPDSEIDKAYGMWVERDFTSGGTLPDTYTFTVYACWYAAGIDTPSNLETVVRLYDPYS